MQGHSDPRPLLPRAGCAGKSVKRPGKSPQAVSNCSNLCDSVCSLKCIYLRKRALSSSLSQYSVARPASEWYRATAHVGYSCPALASAYNDQAAKAAMSVLERVGKLFAPAKRRSVSDSDVIVACTAFYTASQLVSICMRCAYFVSIGQSFDWCEPIGLQERLEGRSSHNGEFSVMSRSRSQGTEVTIVTGDDLLAAAKPANSLLLCIKFQEDIHLYQQSNQSALRKTKPGLHASTDP